METTRLAGYAFLINRYHLNVPPHWHRSSVSHAGTVCSTIQDGEVEAIYPRSYWPGETTGDHLEFALKYDGINLIILFALFETAPVDEIINWIRATPTGKYARKVWFLYEFLTGLKLPLPDLTKGNYLPVLNPEEYYTTIPGRRIPRQRIVDNLLGGPSFCPMIRRTEKLANMERMDLHQKCEAVIKVYPAELLRRALAYLYNKETKSSFEIEHIEPSAVRIEKFISLLKMAEHKDFCEKPLLIEVQNRIVDPRFQDKDYRTNQNYIGQSMPYQKEIIHYVCPKPEDLLNLMEGLLSAHHMMKAGKVSAIIHAAAISYGFVFLHPFEDGNGRIHRFLIHNILSLQGAVPKGLMFPISATLLKHPALYDDSLEAFSKPLMQFITYDLNDMGEMKVEEKTRHWYRYIDMTAQAEALYDFVKLTIEQELVEELNFLASYDKTKQAIQEIVDMPDRLIDLFIRICLQNKGRLSAKKREAYFEFLTDAELRRLENAIKLGYEEVLKRHNH
ncbi:MAG: Fic family protein [Gammaproteobacteria bacterium]